MRAADGHFGAALAVELRGDLVRCEELVVGLLFWERFILVFRPERRLTDELLRETRRIWSKAYRRPIDDREATEILMNVKRFAEVLLKAAKAESKR